MPSNIDQHTVECSGVTLHFAHSRPEQQGHEGPTMVFFHGFPEFWRSWQQQLNYFGERYRVIAPDLPGYNLSGKPADAEFYRIPNLIRIMADFLRQISPDRPVTLIAHDWGGAIAWPMAAFHPELIERLVIINAAHPSTFTRELFHNPAQREKSQYIRDLVGPGAVEKLSFDNYAYLRKLLFGTLAGEPVPDERRAAYEEAWGQPGALQAMANYYRAMPQLGSGPDGQGKSVTMRVPDIHIGVPTLVLWGEQDPAFVPEVLDGLDDYVTDLHVIRYPAQTHWLHHECPLDVSQQIEGFMAHK